MVISHVLFLSMLFPSLDELTIAESPFPPTGWVLVEAVCERTDRNTPNGCYFTTQFRVRKVHIGGDELVARPFAVDYISLMHIKTLSYTGKPPILFLFRKGDRGFWWVRRKLDRELEVIVAAEPMDRVVLPNLELLYLPLGCQAVHPFVSNDLIASEEAVREWVRDMQSVAAIRKLAPQQRRLRELEKSKQPLSASWAKQLNQHLEHPERK